MKKISGLRIAVMGVLAAVLLAGCGVSSDGPGQKQAASTQQGAGESAMLKKNKGERIYTDWFFQ